MTREFEVDLSIRGEYDDSKYEIEAVEEALAEWNLMFPDEYAHLDEARIDDAIYNGPDSIIVEEVHVDSVNSWLIVS